MKSSEFSRRDVTEGYKKPILPDKGESLSFSAADLIARTFQFTAPYNNGEKSDNFAEAHPQIPDITDVVQQHD